MVPSGIQIFLFALFPSILLFMANTRVIYGSMLKAGYGVNIQKHFSKVRERNLLNNPSTTHKTNLTICRKTHAFLIMTAAFYESSCHAVLVKRAPVKEVRQKDTVDSPSENIFLRPGEWSLQRRTTVGGQYVQHHKIARTCHLKPLS